MKTNDSKQTYLVSGSRAVLGLLLMFTSTAHAQTQVGSAPPAPPVLPVAVPAAPAEASKAAAKAEWPFEWLTEFDKAMDLAKKRDLPVMLVFSGSDWCIWCQKLDQEIFQQQEFKDYARAHVVSVMLDTPRSMMSSQPHKALMEMFGVSGFPAVVLVDKSGSLIRKGGYVRGGPSAFITFLKNAASMQQRAANTRPLKFDRSPSAVLRVLQQQMEAAQAGSMINDEDQFVMDVTLGNWPAVKAYLRSLPADNAEKIYGQLLSDFRETRSVRSSESSSRKQKSMLSLEDFFAICDFYPGADIQRQMGSGMLAELLKLILESGDYRAALLDTLEKGTRHLGGTDPKARMAAARLLFDVDLKLDAGKFLPPAELSKKNKDIGTLKMRITYLAEKARAEKDATAMVEAWDLGQWILLNTASGYERTEAFALTLSLLPTLEGQMASAWLKGVFRDNPLLGMKLLTTLGDALMENTNSGDLKKRGQNLVQLARAVQALLDVATDGSWDKTLNALALCWAREAELSLENYRKPQKNSRYGAMYGNAPERPSSTTFVPLGEVLAASPAGTWFDRLEGGVKIQVLTLKARLCMKNEEMEEAMAIIVRLAKDKPKICSGLFNEYLRAWSVVANNAPSETEAQMQERLRRQSMYGMYGMPNMAGMEGIPITRARQVRNLLSLAGLLKEIQRLTSEPVSAATAVTVFTECHSKAEVFLKEDIENVFGPFEKMPSEVRIQLIEVMRTRLADTWQKVENQTSAKTNRSELQMIAEVSRGYRILQALIQASEADADNWQYHRLKAMAMYDSAEYYYSIREKKLPEDAERYTLAEYTRQRDEALNSFRKSAQCYSKIAPKLHPAEHSVLVYLHWFYVTLGASDLAHLKRSADYNLDYLADIRKAMDLLPDELKEKHLRSFGDTILSASSQIGSDIKMRFLRASLAITGDHPTSQPIKKLLDYYAELLGELKLAVRVDAEQPGGVVGSQKPFGLFIELEHSRNIERESGGFGRYLQGAGQHYYGGKPPVDFLETFKKYITDALVKNFEIESLVFATPAVQSRQTARANWNVTPLAYCLLKVKDKAVDAIPPIQMDMAFADTQGPVVLPLLSDILPIDARTEPPLAPVRDLAITQVLDDRELAKGKLKLQIDVAANGLIPGFEELFEMTPEGFSLEGKIADHDRGLVIDKLDTEAARVTPICQRSWDLTYVVPKDRAVTFRFPVIKPRFKDAKVTNKRYEDADIVPAGASMTIKAEKIHYRLYLFGLAGVLALGLLGWLLSRRRKVKTEAGSAHKLPETLTAFTLLNYLRHLEADGALALSEQQRDALRQDIERVEKAYFSPDTGNDPAAKPELRQIAAHYADLNSRR